MYSAKIRPPGSYDACKPRQSTVEGRSCIYLRHFLIAWAFLRLAVSVFWSGLLIFSTVWTIRNTSIKNQFFIDIQYLIPLQIISDTLQFVEITMIIIFILAGIKKNVSLYLMYYRYCLVTFVLYIIVVILILILGYDKGHYFAEVYITYHIADFTQLFGFIIQDLGKAFFVVAAIDILLELLLIRLVKKMILRYDERSNGQFV